MRKIMAGIAALAAAAALTLTATPPTTAAAAPAAAKPAAVKTPPPLLPWGAKPANGRPTAAAPAAPAAAGSTTPKGRPPAAGASRKAGASLMTCTDPCYFYTGGIQVADNGGAYANLVIDNTYIHTDEYHTLVELAVQTGNQQQTVEVGIRVAPDHYLDSDPHVFVYHWVNGTATCYDACGYVPYGTPTYPAGADVSALIGTNPRAGLQYFNGDWWVAFYNEWIGYFPGSLWTGATPAATFTRGGLVQGFWEVASTHDQPCSDAGRDGLHGSDTSAARIGTYALIDSLSSPVWTLITDTDASYYSSYKASNTTIRGGGPGDGNVANGC